MVQVTCVIMTLTVMAVTMPMTTVQVSNVDQSDIDQDGQGGVCDNDTDNDGIINTVDNCPNTL